MKTAPRWCSNISQRANDQVVYGSKLSICIFFLFCPLADCEMNKVSSHHATVILIRVIRVSLAAVCLAIWWLTMSLNTSGLEDGPSGRCVTTHQAVQNSIERELVCAYKRQMHTWEGGWKLLHNQWLVGCSPLQPQMFISILPPTPLHTLPPPLANQDNMQSEQVCCCVLPSCGCRIVCRTSHSTLSENAVFPMQDNLQSRCCLTTPPTTVNVPFILCSGASLMWR